MKWRCAFRLGCLALLVLCTGFACAQPVTVTARVAWNGGKPGHKREAPQAVVWLTPLGETLPEWKLSPGAIPKLVQKNKSFSPHLLIVPVGSVVQFPNRDPFFHNVFSLFDGKRFDLGLYEAGTSRNVHFDKPGISYIFCNIHAEMSAVVITLPTPYYAISNQQGEVVIPNVPAGRYTLRVWYEAAQQEELDAQTREIAVSETSSTLGVLHLTPPAQPPAHTDKYGGEYAPPDPGGPAYTRP
jgi:hypothetical protein